MSISSNPTETTSSTRSFNIVTYNSPSNPNLRYPTNGPTMQHSIKPTFSVSDWPSMSPTFEPSSNPTMLSTTLPSAEMSGTPSSNPSTPPTMLPSHVPSASPSITSSSRPSHAASASPSIVPSSVPSAQATPFPSKSPTFMPSDFPVSTPSAHPTKVTSISPSLSHQPSVIPTAKPSFIGSNRPTMSSSPSMIPTNLKTLSPTSSPTSVPTSKPTNSPTLAPTSAPTTANPTASPTKSFTPNPTVAETNAPTSSPTSSPSSSPTAVPTKLPTSSPTVSPTNAPSSSPTSSPTAVPTKSPTSSPTNLPSPAPTSSPTSSPTAAPTKSPTPIPDDTDFQCCFDLQTLTCRVDWCGESESNCGGCGITVKWMEPESSCMPLYADCSTDTDGCCGSTSCVQQGVECPGDGSYCQCLLSTEEMTEAPATSPVVEQQTSSPTQAISAWRLHTTSEETVSNCLWDVKRIRFYGSSDCSTDEISTVGGTSFSSGHKSYSSSTNAFKSNDVWAGTCKNGEYWIGIFFPHEVDIHCVSIQNDYNHEVNSLSVQKKNLVTGAWEEVAFKENMNTSDQAVNIISIQDTMPPVTEPTTSDDTDFQCCFDLQTLTCRVDWCGESEYNCGGCGITVKWMEPDSSCMPLYADCSTDTDGCCGSTSCVQQGVECPGDGSYCQCLLSTENPISISYVNFDGAVANTESDEYVEISSNSNNPIDISGYYVYVATTGNQGPTFYFPEGTILASHSIVKVYTDEVHEESGGFSFGSGKAIWNNSAGHAILKNSSDEIVAEYEYESTNSPTAAPTKSPTRLQVDTNGISITNIFYDGLVPRSESDEYIEISNDSDGAIDITGFYVYVDKSGEQGATFVFPEGTVLDVGSSVRVYTDEIHEESGGFSFGSGRAIWNNGGGVGILKDNNDELVSEYSYP
ncbi:hypothetical protein CTEN210_14440 [Chaetoceros tenuissimus]|uniref:LTD domain-containing protein n=1 Tax=Chaetoceros tenuissimus TaxID=426638 RepID=A0AAD3HBY8_9STRA|nr:hypothetical protein CTEN210_14440 [Chaetoceros tenuissimus]